MSVLPRIAYDARLSLGQYRGMGRFLRMLISGHERDFVGLCAGGEQDSSLNLVASGFKPYPLWEQISLPRLVRSYDIEVFLAPYNTAPLNLPTDAKLLLVVHDLIFMERLPLSKSLYQNAGRWYRRLVVPRAIERADAIVTVSHYTARQLGSRYSLDKNRIHVIPNSIGEEWFSAEPAQIETQNYMLAVAGEAPSKNLSRALAAFAMCRKLGIDSSLRLKVGGVKERFHPVFQKEARRLGIGDLVDFLPYIPGVEMRRLYRNAILFLMPSLSEGFGIPVLEAMASGTPVVVSSASSLPEIAGNAARYFAPTSVEDMAEAIRDVASNQEVRQQMSIRGLQQARKYHPSVINRTVAEFWTWVMDGGLRRVPGRHGERPDA